jgi:hypothetical protein
MSTDPMRRIAPFIAVAALAVVVPAVLAATPARILPTQRVDVTVPLISAAGTEPGYGAGRWELQPPTSGSTRIPTTGARRWS